LSSELEASTILELDPSAAMRERMAVTDVLYRYASTIDRRDLVGLRATLHDDIEAKYGNGDWIHGGDALLAWIDTATEGTVWQHHMLNVYHVDFVSDTEAKTLTYHTSHQTTSDAPDTCRKIVARYYDTVRKVDGRWLIADKYMQIGWTQEFHH